MRIATSHGRGSIRCTTVWRIARCRKCVFDDACRVRERNRFRRPRVWHRPIARFRMGEKRRSLVNARTRSIGANNTRQRRAAGAAGQSRARDRRSRRPRTRTPMRSSVCCTASLGGWRCRTMTANCGAGAGSCLPRAYRRSAWRSSRIRRRTASRVIAQPAAQVIHGACPVDPAELPTLLAHLGQSAKRPLLLGRAQTATPTWPFPTVRELACTPILDGAYVEGWLLAINHASAKAAGLCEFGSAEIRLLESVATILGVHRSNTGLILPAGRFVRCRPCGPLFPRSTPRTATPTATASASPALRCVWPSSCACRKRDINDHVSGRLAARHRQDWRRRPRA